MSNVVERTQCTGCGACLVTCPVSAITMDKKPDGFSYAVINDHTCIHCERCRKVCPVLDPPGLRSQEAVYAAQSRSHEVLMTSASGGAFYELARAFLQDEGIVYGAVMDIDNSRARIEHKPARTISELSPMQGSKYAQGDAWPVFREVAQALKRGERVLFSGLPCQVAGLYGFLGHDWPNLTTIDLFCHGNTSTTHLNLYLQYLRDKYHEEVVGYTFRDKEHGVGYNPRIAFSDGHSVRTTALRDGYWYLFQNSKFYRESCHTCPYACDCRVGDLSIGDFWGIEKERPELLSTNGGPIDSSRGISVILANTAKGNDLACTADLVRAECAMADVVPGGAVVREAQPMPEDRDTVLALFRAGDYAAIKRYCIRKMGIHNYLINRFSSTAPIRFLRKLLSRS